MEEVQVQRPVDLKSERSGTYEQCLECSMRRCLRGSMRESYKYNGRKVIEGVMTNSVFGGLECEELALFAAIWGCLPFLLAP